MGDVAVGEEIHTDQQDKVFSAAICRQALLGCRQDKIRDIKLTQKSSTSSSIASLGDAYEQVLGRDRTGRDSLAGRRVRILNFSGQVVASGILMSDENDNVVMGKKLGVEYYEVSILIAHDPTASLFIKDADRKNMNDDVGSHIIWFIEY
ncbi:hypothetical protein Taro_036070, partial [Colocasia esculenta]|nr:hypothetical protein [Colocasia esculenta]